jgi:hypothetical protein
MLFTEWSMDVTCRYFYGQATDMKMLSGFFDFHPLRSLIEIMLSLVARHMDLTFVSCLGINRHNYFESWFLSFHIIIKSTLMLTTMQATARGK